MPGKPGAWDLIAITQWIAAKERERGYARKGGSVDTQAKKVAERLPSPRPKSAAQHAEDWDLENVKFTALLKKLAFDLKSEVLVERSVIERQWVGYILLVKRRLLDMPKRVALSLVGLDAPDIVKRLEQEVCEVLEDLAAIELPADAAGEGGDDRSVGDIEE